MPAKNTRNKWNKVHPSPRMHRRTNNNNRRHSGSRYDPIRRQRPRKNNRQRRSQNKRNYGAGAYPPFANGANTNNNVYPRHKQQTSANDEVIVPGLTINDIAQLSKALFGGRHDMVSQPCEYCIVDLNLCPDYCAYYKKRYNEMTSCPSCIGSNEYCVECANAYHGP